MCGRARACVAPEALGRAVGMNPPPPVRRRSRYRPNANNLCPGRGMPVAYTTASGELALRVMQWGLVPSYESSTAKPNFFKMFNARSETVASKGVFKRLLKRRRCVVSVNGFYEWKKEGKDKQPYYIHRKDGRPMLMAGLYDTWLCESKDTRSDAKGEEDDEGGAAGAAKDDKEDAHDEHEDPTEGGSAEEDPETAAIAKEEDKDGKLVFTFTILTTDSGRRLKWLHDRQPVIISEEQARVWVDCTSSGKSGEEGYDLVKDLKLEEPYDEEDLVWYPVTKKMGNVRYSDPDLWKEMKLEAPSPITKFFAAKPKDTTPTKGDGGGSSSSSTGKEGEDSDGKSDVKRKLPVHEETQGASGEGASSSSSSTKKGKGPMKAKVARKRTREDDSGGSETGGEEDEEKDDNDSDDSGFGGGKKRKVATGKQKPKATETAAKPMPKKRGRGQEEEGDDDDDTDDGDLREAMRRSQPTAKRGRPDRGGGDEDDDDEEEEEEGDADLMEAIRRSKQKENTNNVVDDDMKKAIQQSIAEEEARKKAQALEEQQLQEALRLSSEASNK